LAKTNGVCLTSYKKLSMAMKAHPVMNESYPAS